MTARWLGRFLEDPLEVPDGVLEFVAGKQLGLAELAEVKRHTEREHTRFEHQWEIKKNRGYREFDDAAVAQGPGASRERPVAGEVPGPGGGGQWRRAGAARRRCRRVGWPSWPATA